MENYHSYCEPVPSGAEVKIYIGGDGVARGYLNYPELTAERFLHDPFNEDSGARMYQTGGLASYLPEDNLVFLGRIDHQIKLRGFRIELCGIEARLVKHPKVYEAVVQSYNNGNDKRLVAYMVVDESPSLAQNPRMHISELLPIYHLVPVAYVCLPSFPLTPNGKLNGRALPAPDDEAFALITDATNRSSFGKKLTTFLQPNIDKM